MPFVPTNKTELQTAVDLWISNNSQAVTNYGNINTWDTSLITDMSSLFIGKTTFNDDISNWDVSNVTDMNRMFANAHAFNNGQTNNEGTAPLSWDTSNVTDMTYAFYRTTVFNQYIGNWNTSNVTTMYAMLYEAVAFNNGQTNNEGTDPLNWDTSNVTTMAYAFYGTTVFNQYIGNWNTSNVTTMRSMFYMTHTFNNGQTNNEGTAPLNWDTSNVTTMRTMLFKAFVFNQPIGNWNTSKVTTMYCMLYWNYQFNQDISTKQVTVNGNTYTAWDTSKVTSMSYMLQRAYDFNQPIGNWNTSSVINMQWLLFRCNAFDQNIGDWNLSSLTGTSFSIVGAGYQPTSYSNLLISLSQNDNLPLNYNLGVTGYIRLDNAATNAAYDLLTKSVELGGKNWTILDGGNYTISEIESIYDKTQPYMIEVDTLNQTHDIRFPNLVITDSGGISQPHGDDEDNSLLLTSSFGAITLSGNVDMKANEDYLKIYDGENDSSPLLYNSGAVGHETISITTTNPSDKLFITVVSSGSVNGSGFFLNVSTSLDVLDSFRVSALNVVGHTVFTNKLTDMNISPGTITTAAAMSSDPNVDFRATITLPDATIESITDKPGLISIVRTLYSEAHNVAEDRIFVTLSAGSVVINIDILTDGYYAPTCFPAGTPIQTDQGETAIDQLVPGEHTLRGKSIIAITQTRPLQKHIICFEKDSIGKNVPSQQTLCSKEHKVLYRGEMTKARDLVDMCKNVKKVAYNSETLYNVLLEKHGKMLVNNMICETLHPENISGKFAKSKSSMKRNAAHM